MSDDAVKPNNEKEGFLKKFKDKINNDKEKKEFLRKLKNEISKNTEFVCEYHKGRDCIWVGTHDGLIGDEVCHYEVFFYLDRFFVEAHFDDDDFEGGQKIKLTEEAEEKLIFGKWYGKRRRIIYKDNKDFESKNLGDDNLLRKVIDSLRKMDRLIGAELRRIVCAQRNYVILKVNDTHYKKDKNFPILSKALFITACVISVGAVIIKCFLSFDIVATVGLLMLAALLFVLSVIVRLRTDDARWIKLELKSSVLDSMNGKELTKENCKILMDIMEL
ncbi:MAG: hypothetical protein J1E07_09305 [Treponema sp.]|nr:hypothetical protein [Treponema sp.]